MSKKYFTIKKDRIYEEWVCACPTCTDYAKVYFKQRNRWPDLGRPMEAEHRMDIHGNEYHRVELQRIFKAKNDITTTFEVVPTHAEYMKESDERMDRKFEAASVIIKEFAND